MDKAFQAALVAASRERLVARNHRWARQAMERIFEDYSGFTLGYEDWAGLALYALTTAAAVGAMLMVVAGLPFWLTAGTVLIGEAVCIPLGWPIARRLRDWGMLR